MKNIYRFLATGLLLMGLGQNGYAGGQDAQPDTDGRPRGSGAMTALLDQHSEEQNSSGAPRVADVYREDQPINGQQQDQQFANAGYQSRGRFDRVFWKSLGTLALSAFAPVIAAGATFFIAYYAGPEILINAYQPYHSIGNGNSTVVNFSTF